MKKLDFSCDYLTSRACSGMYRGMIRLAWIAVVFSIVFAGSLRAMPPILYDGDGSDLQAVIDAAPPNAVIECNPASELTLSESIWIAQPLTLRGLRARLPEGLGRTPLLVVTAPGVALEDLFLIGNYASVPQSDRSPLVLIHAGEFRVERARFEDASKDGVLVTPTGGVDIAVGVVRDIEAYRMGRDAVSIAGDNRGARVRNVLVERVRLQRGYHRGAVEISDGTDAVTAREVYAEDAVYAVDVQDHGVGSAPNRNITLENIAAVDCRHLVRTLNSPRGHANLTLRNGTAIRCWRPVALSNTDNVLVESLRVVMMPGVQESPVQLDHCRNVLVNGLFLESLPPVSQPVAATRSRNVIVQDVRGAAGAPRRSR